MCGLGEGGSGACSLSSSEGCRWSFFSVPSVLPRSCERGVCTPDRTAEAIRQIRDAQRRLRGEVAPREGTEGPPLTARGRPGTSKGF